MGVSGSAGPQQGNDGLELAYCNQGRAGVLYPDLAAQRLCIDGRKVYPSGIGRLDCGRTVMPGKKYRIKLTPEEQQELKALVSRGGRRISRPTPASCC